MNPADTKTSEFHREAAKLLGTVLAAFGLLFLVTIYTANVPMLERGVRAKGVIEQVGRGSRGNATVTLRVGKPGGEVLRIDTIASRQEYYQPGDIVYVIYNSEHPSGAWVSRVEHTAGRVPMGLWLSALAVLIGIGLHAWAWVMHPVRKFWWTGRE